MPRYDPRQASREAAADSTWPRDHLPRRGKAARRPEAPGRAAPADAGSSEDTDRPVPDEATPTTPTTTEEADRASA